MTAGTAYLAIGSATLLPRPISSARSPPSINQVKVTAMRVAVRTRPSPPTVSSMMSRTRIPPTSRAALL